MWSRWRCVRKRSWISWGGTPARSSWWIVPSPQSNSSRCPPTSTIWLGPARCKQGCGVPVPVRISLIAVLLPNFAGPVARRPSWLTAVYIPRVYPCVGQALRDSREGRRAMSVTGPELFSVLHGMGFGAAFLLTYTGGLEALWGLDPDGTGQARGSARLRRLRFAICCMAVLAWLTVLTGLYGLYPWYRAEPTIGAALTRFPRAYLRADPSLAAWSTFVGDWKAHIACLCPILSTAVAAVVI